MLAVVPAEKKLGALFRLAIKSGAMDAIALHLRRGESVNGRDDAGFTPLMLAVIHSQRDVCVRLLDAGADPALVSPGGRTATEIAVEHGHIALASFLSRRMLPQTRTICVAVSVPETMTAESDGASADDGRAAESISDGDAAAPEVEAGLSKTWPETVLGDFGGFGTDQPLDPINGWVPDETVVPPRHNADCASSAREAQRLISAHRRVNDETDWSDVELDLPEARVQGPSISQGEMAAVEELLSNGLDAGFVNSADLWNALAADGALEIERAHHVLMRMLDDLGILVEPCTLTYCARAPVSPDELSDVIDVLCADLTERADPSAIYAAQARRIELIKREDEERLGRRMDSALGGLTRALASLPSDQWQRAFPAAAQANALMLPGVEDEDFEGSSREVAEGEVVDADEQIDFRAYVALVRSGMSEYGREALVPRPKPAELNRLLGLVPDMQRDTSNAVISSISAYEKARDQLVTANLRLAMSLAYGYRYRDLPLEDLIQDANLGLMRAAEKYDFRRGFKFSTYATAWIRQSITRGLADTARLIRVPVHMVEKINAVNRVRRELEYGRESAVGLDEIAERLSLSAEAVGRIINSDMQVMSLEECGADREIHTPDALSIVDLAPDPLQYACDRSLTAAIERMLADFDKRDRKVLVLRYGFDGLDTMTLEEVGQQFNVTRERIRQIEAKALRKLRHRSRSDVLLPYAATSLHPAVATQDKT